MLNAQDLKNVSIAERKTLILQEAGSLDCDEIERAGRISRVLSPFLSDYFDIQEAADLQDPKGSVLGDANLDAALAAEISNFRTAAVADLRVAISQRGPLLHSPKNIWEMTGAAKLALANQVTRTLNTKLGLLWERLANISPYVINPEAEFDIALAGIDLIARNYHTGSIEYQQLKTQHNTLTGSQKPRSVAELSIHDNPVFCACFANASWTFSHPDIPRVSGADFWSRIGIPYDLFFRHVRGLVLDLEDEYVNLL
ncbi:MAG: hypothetical protein P8M13_01785 [Luminiphilus sp.]|nr:hypothetical protein [Luminiphilus sp.]